MKFVKYLDGGLSVPRLRNFFPSDSEYEKFLCKNIYAEYIKNKKIQYNTNKNFSVIGGLATITLSLPYLAILVKRIMLVFAKAKHAAKIKNASAGFFSTIKELPKFASWIDIAVAIGLICVVMERIPDLVDATKKIIAALKNEEYIDPTTALVVPLSGGELTRDANSNKYEDNEINLKELVLQHDKERSYEQKNNMGNIKLFR